MRNNNRDDVDWSGLPEQESNAVFVVAWILLGAICISAAIGLYFTIKAM